jgi:hypothetical protein
MWSRWSAAIKRSISNPMRLAQAAGQHVAELPVGTAKDMGRSGILSARGGEI